MLHQLEPDKPGMRSSVKRRRNLLTIITRPPPRSGALDPRLFGRQNSALG